MRLFLITLFGILAVSCSPLDVRPLWDGMTWRTAVVLSVTDGDTVDVELAGGQKKTIRFLYIDAPEKSSNDRFYRTTAQAARQGGITTDEAWLEYGGRAREAAECLLPPGTVIRLGTVPGNETDRYGRTLGMIFCGATNVNWHLVRAGYAWFYPYGSARDSADRSWRQLFKTAQALAQKERKGFWALYPDSSSSERKGGIP